MNSENSENSVSDQDEAALLSALEQSRKQLDALKGELRAVDSDLQELDVERQQFALLSDVCGALEKLDEQEAADLFWNGVAEAAAGQAHVGLVRSRVDEFQHRLSEIEVVRQGVLARIQREEDNGEWVADDLYELKRLEEERKNEWVVERDEIALSDRPSAMPWTRGGEDDQRFRKTLALSLLLSLLFGVLFPLIPMPALDRWEVIEVPERLTKLIEERKVIPPPAQELLPERKPEEIEEPTPLLAEEGTPEPTTTKAEPKPGAGAKGILAFREKFSSLADSAPAKLGSQARVSRAGELASGRASRSLVATNGPGSSGGIDISSLSRNVGGGGGEGMAGVQVAQATSGIGDTLR